MVSKILSTLTGGKFGLSEEEKAERVAQVESQALAQAIGERELARPGVEAEVQRQVEAKGYLSSEEEEAIRLKIEKQQRFARSPAGQTFAQLKAEAKEMAEDTRPSFVERQIQKVIGRRPVRYTKAQLKRLRRVAPRAKKRRVLTRKFKKPTKKQIAARMKFVRLMEARRAGVRAPTQRRPVPVYRAQRSVRMPTTMSEVNKMRSVAHLLTPAERYEIEQKVPFARRAAALMMIKRKIESQQKAFKRQQQMQNRFRQPEQRMEISMFTGRPVVRVKNIRREAWTL